MIVERFIAACETEEWTNDRGNHVTAVHGLDGDRYLFDFQACTAAEGWEQWDTEQDASYFGVWIHRGARLTLTYAEGDLTLVRCPTAETFRAEIAHAEGFYGDAPVVARGIDADGAVTEYVSDRASADSL